MHKIFFPENTFNADTIMDSGQVFRFSKIKDKYLCLSGCHTLEFVVNKDNTEITCDTDDILFFEKYFDIETDYASFNRKIETGDDSFLKDALKYSNGMRILRQDLWETIISYMISQNNNIPKIKKSIGTLVERYSNSEAFPTPKALACLSLQELSDGTMLGYRAEYILEFSKNVADGNIDLEELAKLDYEASREFLLEKKGIGPKVASCICLYGLHHLQGYPIDTWMKKIIEEDYSRYSEKDYMKYINESFGGFQGYVQQLQFYYKRRK